MKHVSIFVLLVFAAPLASNRTIAAPGFPPNHLEFFESKVRPLLVKHCYECHSGESKKLQADLRLDGRELSIKGGESGPAVVPGKPNDSLLVQAVRWESVEMPPKEKLADDQIAVLVKWVEMGAPWPSESPKQIIDAPKAYDWDKLRQEHWAWRAVEKPVQPPINEPSGSINAIDRFVLAKLDSASLKRAEPARPRVLVRRIYLDLIGLPPTPKQVEQFVKAASRDRQSAVKSLVDELLGSRHYGERWGRYWLDVARYSDGFGGFLDAAALPQAWRYRDWVVESFNQDMPFDEFVQLQIAGDIIGSRNHVVATGFFALGPTYRSDGGDPDSVAQAKGETLDDRVDTFSRGLLGLTVSCARCHDHKFDPIPQLDYYSIAGIFNNTRVGEAPLASADIVKQYNDHQNSIKDLGNKIKQQQNQIKKQKRQPNDKEKDQIEAWKRDLEELRKSSPAKYDHAHALLESGSADMSLAIRGNLRKPGEKAPRRFLRVLAGESPDVFVKGSGRAELASAVTDPRNPLTARVFVNRVWLHHFGHALVRTPSNFGTLGEPPTHPQLLDWLAATLVESGWSVKQLHRTIMLSATYQMSSTFDEQNFAADGDNRLLWRMNPRRLDVESWRDSLLAVTGELDRTAGGPPAEDANNRRRTLYFKVSRNGDRFSSDQFLRLFDFPLMRATVAQRPTSIVPQQYLFMMNSPFMVARAKSLVARLQEEATSDKARIELAYRLLFGRSPTNEEERIGLDFIKPRHKQEDLAKAKPQSTTNDEMGDILIADFEGDTYGDWKAEGEAFGPGPAQGTLRGQMAVSGYQGHGLVNSFYKGDRTTGKLTSPEFKIQRRHINFLVGGGKYPGKTCINLLVSGKVVRTATGPNDRGGGSERLAWASWNVAEFDGESAVVQIVDDRTGGWGHVNVDHIYQSNKSDGKAVARPILADKPALSPWHQYAQVLLSSNEFMYVQ